MLRSFFAVVWLAAGVGWAYWAHRHLLRLHGATRSGRFLANWIGCTLYLVGVGSVIVLTNDGWHQGRRGDSSWYPPMTWPQALAIALVAGLLIGAAMTFADSLPRVAWAAPAPAPEPAHFPPSYVTDVLEAEGRASPDECRRLARHLLKTSRRVRQPLPPALDDFAQRHLPTGYFSRGV